MKKATGLAAFTSKGKTAPAPEPAMERQRQRGKGGKVALTVRVPRAEWERIHQLAVAEGTSIQALAIEGLSKVFAERGLPELTA